MTDTSSNSEKAELRRHAAATRSQLIPSADLEDALAANILSLKQSWRGLTVAGYWAMRNELSLTPALLALAGQGATLALPVTEPDSMSFRQWDGGDLVEGSFGIMEPPASSPDITPDVVLVPLLAFDRKGNRLGYGKGYYDRALADLKAVNPTVLAVGIAFAEQICLFPLPAEPHDYKLDLVATPLQVFDFRH
jgi:5-formyltetrahydrofolate cyclo-ligase